MFKHAPPFFPRRARRGRAGFTMVEMMIAMTVTMLVMAGLGQSFMLLTKNFYAVGNYVDLSAQSRNTLGWFGRDMRMTSNVYKAETTDGDGDGLVTLDVDIQTSSGTVGVTYEYDINAQTFSRTSGGNTEVLLRDCRALTLDYFDINGASTTNLPSIKKVQLSAITERYVQSVENTDLLITATYMMRNRNVTN